VNAAATIPLQDYLFATVATRIEMTDLQHLKKLAEALKKYDHAFFTDQRRKETDDYIAACSPDVVLSILEQLETAHMNGYEGGKQEARDAAQAEREADKAAMRLALDAFDRMLSRKPDFVEAAIDALRGRL
jgi:hypothetical protein